MASSETLFPIWPAASAMPGQAEDIRRMIRDDSANIFSSKDEVDLEVAVFSAQGAYPQMYTLGAYGLTERSPRSLALSHLAGRGRQDNLMRDRRQAAQRKTSESTQQRTPLRHSRVATMYLHQTLPIHVRLGSVQLDLFLFNFAQWLILWPESTPPAHRIIQPTSGWGRLRVSHDGMMALLETLAVFSDLYRYLRVFGVKNFARDEHLGGFDANIEWGDEPGHIRTLESCHLLKYFEPTDPSDDEVTSWSIRHALVYQKVCLDRRDGDANDVNDAGYSNHILVRPSRAMSRRLGSFIKVEKETRQRLVAQWMLFHSLLIDTVEDGLRGHLNHLDDAITQLADRAVMSSEDPTRLYQFDTLRQASRDIKALRSLADDSLRVARAADVNIETLASLYHFANSLYTSPYARSASGEQVAELASLMRQAANARAAHVTHARTARTLVTQAQAIVDQYRDTIAFRNGEVTRLAMEASKTDAMVTIALAAHASREASILKMLTVLALVFAPASLVTDFIQAGFLKEKGTGKGLDLEVSPDLKVYLVIALPLITVILAVYVLVERRLSNQLHPTIRSPSSISVHK